MPTNLRCLHELFETQAIEFPDAAAVSMDGHTVTFAELDAQSNRIANYLRSLGAAGEVLIGICAERSIEMVVAILAVLKTGAGYVPLDPTYPEGHLSQTLSDSGCKLVLTTRELAVRLPRTHVSKVALLDCDVAAAFDATSPRCAVDASQTAYVIYTSGSSGAPKGVVVEHRQVTRLFDSTRPWFRFARDDVWTMFHSFAFDFSVWELWGALLHGARLVVVEAETARSPDAFLDLLERERVTVLSQTPSAFHQLDRVASAGGYDRDLSLRQIVFGGEVLDPQMLRGWMNHFGDGIPSLINMYGITETTVHVTHRRIVRADLEQSGPSPIGVPIPDMRVWVLDPSGKPVQRGQAGEIFVGGAGVARGYLNRPELTKERFVQIPSLTSDRLYRSGDLALVLDDGSLAYAGRADEQLKVRGFRVEPGEVEFCLRRSNYLSDVAVIARDYGDGDTRLVACVVPRSGRAPDVIENLRRVARTHLPEHMRPSAYALIEELPLTANGKVDRRALLMKLDTASMDVHTDSRHAMTPLQQTLSDIWRLALQVSQVGLEDDFFDKGGTSLSAVTVLLAIRQRLGVALPMSVWAENGSVAQFAALLSAQNGPAVTAPALLAD